MKMRLRSRALVLGGVPIALMLCAAATPVHASGLQHGLVITALIATALATGFGVAEAKSLDRFLTAMLRAFHSAERTGELRAWTEPQSNMVELLELAEGYQHAAAAISSVQERKRQSYVESVGALAVALDARDPDTAGHSRRVSESACAVGRAMGLNPQQMERVRVGAMLHDIGKVAVTDAILRKEGPLTDEEATLVQHHPRFGRTILEGVQGFSEFLDAVEQHHENWDGTGYPMGLRGEEIVVEARIIHVADAYDAMTTDRCYRKGMTHEVATRILWSCSGTQFDPSVVSLFSALPQDMLERMRIVAEPVANA